MEGPREGRLSCRCPPPHRIPLRRVYTGRRTLNPLRRWGNPEEPLRMGDPKFISVPLSNFMNVSHGPPPHTRSPHGPALKLSPSFNLSYFIAIRPSIMGKSGWERPPKTFLSSLTLAPPTSGSRPRDATSSACPAVSAHGETELSRGWREAGSWLAQGC